MITAVITLAAIVGVFGIALMRWDRRELPILATAVPLVLVAALDVWGGVGGVWSCSWGHVHPRFGGVGFVGVGVGVACALAVLAPSRWAPRPVPLTFGEWLPLSSRVVLGIGLSASLTILAFGGPTWATFSLVAAVVAACVGLARLAGHPEGPRAEELVAVALYSLTAIAGSLYLEYLRFVKVLFGTNVGPLNYVNEVMAAQLVFDAWTPAVWLASFGVGALLLALFVSARGLRRGPRAAMVTVLLVCVVAFAPLSSAFRHITRSGVVAQVGDPSVRPELESRSHVEVPETGGAHNASWWRDGLVFLPASGEVILSPSHYAKPFLDQGRSDQTTFELASPQLAVELDRALRRATWFDYQHAVQPSEYSVPEQLHVAVDRSVSAREADRLLLAADLLPGSYELVVSDGEYSRTICASFEEPSAVHVTLSSAEISLRSPAGESSFPSADSAVVESSWRAARIAAIANPGTSAPHLAEAWAQYDWAALEAALSVLADEVEVSSLSFERCAPDAGVSVELHPDVPMDAVGRVGRAIPLRPAERNVNWGKPIPRLDLRYHPNAVSTVWISDR